MKKTLLVLLLAGLLLVSATACSKSNTNDETGTGTTATTPNKDPLSGGTTGESDTTEATKNPVDEAVDENIDEDVTAFTDSEEFEVVVLFKSNLRTSPKVIKDKTAEDFNVHKILEADTKLTATGASENWYRVKMDGYEGHLYIAKMTSGKTSDMSGFVEKTGTLKMIGTNENVEDEGVNVRSYPRVLGEYTLLATLTEGQTVNCLAYNETIDWYKISFEKKKGETIETIEGYVSGAYFAEVTADAQ